MQGYTHLYSGNGKGKTSAALGLILRQVGIKNKVALFQFLKNNNSSELVVLKKLGVQLYGSSIDKFYFQMNEQEKKILKENQQQLFKQVLQTINTVDCIVLDEIVDAIQLGLLSYHDLIHLIKTKPNHVELVITAHSVETKLIHVVDYYTEFNAIKHPYKKGVQARKGVEY